MPALKEWVVRVFYKEGFVDPLGEMARRDMRDLGVFDVREVTVMPTYIIKGSISRGSVEKACRELLADPVTQSYTINTPPKLEGGWVVEVGLKPGVTDFVGESVKKGLVVIGISGVESVKTGATYLIKGAMREEELEFLCVKSIVNPLIHDFNIRGGITDARSGD
ncbi:MAG: phosphoribosylformylglycinamidine synthase subunit PurS [Candidatus Bathyarchaeia archaeon]